MYRPAIVATRRFLKKSVIQSGLEVASYAERFGLLPDASGYGSIFTLHRVEPNQNDNFAPNKHLSITPNFLDRVITTLKERGFVGVALDDLPQYAETAPATAPAMVFTLDDGYRNNFVHALPVFKKHNIPLRA